MNQDLEHLRLLSIFHYVVAGLTAFFGCFPILHLVFGIGLLTGAIGGANKPDDRFFGWFVIVLATVMISLFWILAGALVFTGRSLAGHRRYIFCLVVAGIECLFMPFGTVLGVFTIIVLNRESVKQLFAEADTRVQDETFHPE